MERKQEEQARQMKLSLGMVNSTRDLVLRRVFENTIDLAAGKFQPNWEVPYTIVTVGSIRSYALDKLNRTPMPMMWNATHLKRYYQ